MHEDYDPEIEELAEDHEEVEQALLAAVLAYLAGEMTLEAAAAQIDAAAAALEVAGEDWVRDVLPDIYEDGREQARSTLSEPSGASALED
jgi:hypothetical protein